MCRDTLRAGSGRSTAKQRKVVRDTSINSPGPEDEGHKGGEEGACAIRPADGGERVQHRKLRSSEGKGGGACALGEGRSRSPSEGVAEGPPSLGSRRR